jgi:hypothetical protein
MIHRSTSLLTCVRNRGELAEGWYEPETLQKAVQNEAAEHVDDDRPPEPSVQETSQKPRESNIKRIRQEVKEESDSDDSIGPSLPGQEGRSRGARAGPSIPNMQDLELKRGMHHFDLYM